MKRSTSVENDLRIIDAGLIKYGDALQQQETLFNKNIAAKLNGEPTTNYLLLCEHEPVFTLGKSGDAANILVSNEQLNAEFYKTNRGGDITFHGPGQLVAYPILDLDKFNIGLARYIFNLEETIIESLKEYGLNGERLQGANGVWLRPHPNPPPKERGNDRKICAIGVKASRGITMHGLAMNVNTDLSYFNKIIPCGIQNAAVTSLQKELGTEINMVGYKAVFVMCFQKTFENSSNKNQIPKGK